MAERKPAKKGTQSSATSTIETDKRSEGFTAEERAAMKERARALRAEARANEDRASGDRDVPLRGRGEPRRGRHVADLLRAEGVDRRRRGKDQRAREEGRELRTGMATRTNTQSPALHVADSHAKGTCFARRT